MKTLSESQRHYYSGTIDLILSELKKGNELYTFELELTSTVKNDRPLLRRILRTLEAEGLIKNINLGTNIHKWKIA